MVASASLKLRVKIVPCDGFKMLRMDRGEYLVIDKNDESRNVIVEAHTLATIFRDYVEGGLPDGFNHGFGSFWRIEEAVEV